MLKWLLVDDCPQLNNALMQADVSEVVTDDHEDIDLVYLSSDVQDISAYIHNHTGVLLSKLDDLSEKALSLLIEEAEKECCLLSYANPIFFHPMVTALKETLNNGFGKIQSIVIHYKKYTDYLPLLTLLLEANELIKVTPSHLFCGEIVVELVCDDSRKMIIEGINGRATINDYVMMSAIDLELFDESLTATCDDDLNPYIYLVEDVEKSIAYLKTETHCLPHSDMLFYKKLSQLFEQKPGIKVIGLTGGIATGKSTVSAYLKEKGYIVVDADELTHQSYEDEAVKEAIKTYFDCVEDGIIDRRKLGSIVFTNSEARKKLESIIHPYVLKETIKAITSCSQSIIILDVPLLFEANFDRLCDVTIVVACDDDQQLIRLMQRNNLTREDAQRRIDAQMSLDEKRQLADYVIENNQSLEDLYKGIDQLMEVIK
ncbi:MAG: dephospho-CoA kinase [Erysipelotrichaceae bacterium]|nr:dephospho-CoA kinase [Erysipelotrichaceae bacterium]